MFRLKIDTIFIQEISSREQLNSIGLDRNLYFFKFFTFRATHAQRSIWEKQIDCVHGGMLLQGTFICILEILILTTGQELAMFLSITYDLYGKTYV